MNGYKEYIVTTKPQITLPINTNVWPIVFQAIEHFMLHYTLLDGVVTQILYINVLVMSYKMNLKQVILI